MKNLSSFATGVCSVALLVISGCSTLPSIVKPGDASVRLNATSGNEMILRKLDGESPKLFNFYTVSPGSHIVEVGIISEGYQQAKRKCIATLAYDNYQGDQAYTLSQSGSDRDLKIILADGQGQVVASEEKIPCL